MIQHGSNLAIALGLAALLLGCGDDGGGGGGGGGECQGIILDGQCVFPAGDGKGSDWHPDPDGDGIATGTDLCPYTYDPAQDDTDGDGVGDFCDADFVVVAEDGPVVDLRAEHVTPYGAWVRFSSPETSNYGTDYVVAWSQNRADLESASGVLALPEEQKSGLRVFAYFGRPIERPHTITAMEPDTTYFLSARPLDDSDQPTTKDGNIIEIKTAVAPTLTPAGTHPRAWVTPEELQSMKDRHEGGDAAWARWSAIVGDEALDYQNGTATYEFHACVGAALIFHATGDERYKTAALTLIATMKSYWGDNELQANILRWANSHLAICTDLMWNELSSGERNEIVAAYMEDNEAVGNTRIVDTDEYASNARTFIIDGLVACDAPGLDSDLSNRACALLERGLRSFYGVQLVKARRDKGYFAQSGGGLPDGTSYAPGSSGYWMTTLHVLSNVGGQVDAYAPWVWNNFLSLQIHALTPQRRGFVTFGDLDAYDNFDVEPNSLPIGYGGGSSFALQMGFLAKAGLLEEAGHAKWHIENIYPSDEHSSSWPMMLHDHDGLVSRSNEEGLATTYLDSGLGHFFDRTGWGQDDSFFVFQAGWSGVDHMHEDSGSFQIYRKGVWLTSEALGYGGTADLAGAHNVPALSIEFDGEGERVGQFLYTAEASGRLTQSSSQNGYAFVAADLTGNYSSGKYHSHNYDAVQRQVLWIKPGDNDSDDRVVVYDLIDNRAGATPTERGWQLHVDTAHLASQPTLVGGSASYTAESNVQVDVVVPADLVMTFEEPQGTHSNNPGEVYTGRLRTDAGSSDPNLRYVSVLRASDAPTSVVAAGVESTDVVGVVSGSDLVLFQRTANAVVAAEQVAEVSTSGVTTVWWSGLTPGESYSLEASGSSVTLKLGGSLTADEAGMVVGSI